MNLKARKLLVAWLLWLPLASVAGETGQPITLRADEATFRQLDGVGIYRGNAEMEQGLRHLLADRIEIHVNEEGEIIHMEAEGDPLRMREGDDLHARAQHMTYDVPGERILLTGNAIIEQAGRTFTGARVEYDLVSETVSASGDADERVRMTIPGKREEQEQE